MDDLDRLVRRLVQNVRNSHPQYLSQPVEVSELYQTLIPYRHNRTELEIETNQDYEAALCQLLSGERGYTTGDPAMQDAMRKELASPNPNTAVFRDYAAARVTLTSEAVRHFADSPTSLQRGAPSSTPRASSATAGASSAPGTACRYCGGTLPDGRRVMFCPSCGQNLMVQRCPACGTELEIHWKYCITCGRGVAAT
ncbi:MAG: zinc ribbon domain-containing protein [Gemmatimonadaceae bacterium]|nr:zinc ribbon domain-containing protein [Gemmatimonadaceae bacterium]